MSPKQEMRFSSTVMARNIFASIGAFAEASRLLQRTAQKGCRPVRIGGGVPRVRRRVKIPTSFNGRKAQTDGQDFKQ